MDGMSYVYVYIYTLYTGASMPVVCVCVYLVSEEEARVRAVGRQSTPSFAIPYHTCTHKTGRNRRLVLAHA